MAKTRIKTTPTRMQKEALTASAAVNPTNSRIVTEHVLKKRLCALNNSMLTKQAIPIQSTIIVQPPKRTNSISSVTSTISHTSDGHSSIESPPPTSSSNTPTNSNGPTMDELTENAIKTLNAGLLAKTNALALKNRKVYMITEKCDDSNLGNNSKGGGGGSGKIGGTAGGGQKRKMYLIMEEKETAGKNDGQTEKFMKSDCNNGNKKLTLFTDTTNGQLPQKIEKILPEILNCIQAKGAAGGNVLAASGSASNGAGSAKTRFVTQEGNGTTVVCENETSKLRLKADNHNNERLPLTLPPKKNRTKIITTQIIPVNNYHHNPPNPTTSTTANGEVTTATDSRIGVTNVFSTNGAGGAIGISGYARTDKSSATPVIVNASTLMTNGRNGLIIKENGTSTLTSKTPQMHKNINLSTDFLFLMKMLPKLESISEPHKNYVKTCIEDIINQYAPPEFGDQ